MEHHQPCPCGKSSDAYSPEYDYCFSCGEKNITGNSTFKKEAIATLKKSSKFAPLTTVFEDIPERALGKEACKRFGVYKDGENIVYPRFKDGNHVGNKIRGPSKDFWFEGEGSGLDLFGMQAFEKGSAKYLTIVEGQDDAVAAFELMGSRFPVVSVDSSSQAAKDIKRNFEWVDSFENVVLCFDNDEPGQKAVKEVCSLGFRPNKIRVCRLRLHKDANDYKKEGKAKEFTDEWWQSPVYKPDGLILGRELLDTILNRPSHFQVPYPFKSLNKMTYGLRLSEMVVINAQTGVGKTSIIKEIEYSLLTNPEIIEKGYGVGFLHLEEPNADTGLGLLSIHNNLPYHLPDTPRDPDKLKQAFNVVLNNDRVVIWDHFGSNSVDAVLDKVRHMHALGCKYIVVDHLSIIVSDQSGDERKQLDEISTKLKTLCMNLNVALICVILQNRQGEIRGTAGVEQLANIVIKLEREITDANEWRRNVTKATITKNRFCGRCGPALYVWYNELTGRLSELTEEQIAQYERGEAAADDTRPF